MSLPEHIDPPPRRCDHRFESGKRCPKRRQWSKSWCSKHDPEGYLKLTAEQRKSLFSGHAPAIEGVGAAPPVQAGYRHVLSPWFYLEVTAVQETSRRRWITINGKSGPVEIPGWKLKYTVHDERTTPRFLRRSAAEQLDIDEAREMFSSENFEWDALPTTNTGEDAEELGHKANYTGSRAGAVDELESVDEETLNQFAIQSQQVFLMRKAESASDREALALDLRLQAIRAEAKRMGVQLGSEFRQLEHVIGKMEKKLSKRAA